MEAAHAANKFVAGTQIEMIGVAENDFGAEFFEGFIAHAFYGGLRADGHEERSFDGAVRRGQAATPGTVICLEDFEVESHFSSLSGEDEGYANTADDKRKPHGKGDSNSADSLEFAGVRGGETNAG